MPGESIRMFHTLGEQKARSDTPLPRERPSLHVSASRMRAASAIAVEVGSREPLTKPSCSPSAGSRGDPWTQHIAPEPCSTSTSANRLCGTRSRFNTSSAGSAARRRIRTTRQESKAQADPRSEPGVGTSRAGLLTMSGRTRLATSSCALCMLAAGRAQTPEIRVLMSGAFTAAFTELAPGSSAPAGTQDRDECTAARWAAPLDTIPNRLARGEAADVVIMAASASRRPHRERPRGRRQPGRSRALRPSVWRCVPAQPSRTSSTIDALKRTLLQAKSIATRRARAASASIRRIVSQSRPRRSDRGKNPAHRERTSRRSQSPAATPNSVSADQRAPPGQRHRHRRTACLREHSASPCFQRVSSPAPRSRTRRGG